MICFLLLADQLPSYGNFEAEVTFSIPYANNTQHGHVWQNADRSEQRFEWMNRDRIIDVTISHNLDRNDQSYHYMRTEKMNQSCYYYQGTGFADFIPVNNPDW